MDWKLLSEIEPTDVYTGRLWVKPSNGNAFFRLGSTWVPLIGAGTSIIMSRLCLLINGVDKTTYLDPGLSITDILTKEVDSCAFVLTDNTGTNKPQVGQEVLVFYRETAEADPVLKFSGRISEVPQMQYANGKFQYEITCTDFTQALNRKLVTENYSAETAGDIIRDIVDTYVPELGTFHVLDGLTVDYISFNNKFPLECITELAELTGYDWYVDYERNIHFFPPETNDAPYELNDTAASGLFKDLVVNVNKEELKNRVKVRGGNKYSDLFEQIRVADGDQTSFNLDYKPYAPISVYVDTGGGYVAKTLGIDNIDLTGFDFVVNASEKVIKNLDLATLTAGHKLKITYKCEVPIYKLIEDTDSIEAMKELEGGDGIYDAALIIDETITTDAQAKARGRSEIDQYCNPMVEGSFITNQHGYRSGQILTVNIAGRAVNNQYLIRQVTATSLGSGLIEYEVTFATKLKGLTDFLMMLYDSGRKIIEREDELLEHLKVFKEELAITGVISDTQFANVSGNPAKWGPDADEGHWNLSQWG